MITNFKIIVEQKNQTSEFPREFYVNFNEFEREFKIKFVKEAKVIDYETIKSSNDIYVIDENTGEPVKFKTEKSEVLFLFTLKYRRKYSLKFKTGL